MSQSPTRTDASRKTKNVSINIYIYLCCGTRQDLYHQMDGFENEETDWKDGAVGPKLNETTPPITSPTQTGTEGMSNCPI
mmetsp:Transcript_27310/g.44490  ORF Transcript_27310/g.44490 Transcript_27310/m.44490 type:complete len:80 (-) Transcript_27310:200-439(-)